MTYLDEADWGEEVQNYQYWFPIIILIASAILFIEIWKLTK